MTVAELRRRLSCEEFTHWVALYNVEAAEREEARQKQKGKKR